jgi:hypothetical protein
MECRPCLLSRQALIFLSKFHHRLLQSRQQIRLARACRLAHPFPRRSATRRIVLGVFGVHKFYLGYQMEGIIMLVVSVIGFFLCGLPSTAIAVIGLVEGILYLTKPDEEFVKTYVRGRKPWF